MVCASGCSAPCKAFSLNSLPIQQAAAAHICGNQATQLLLPGQEGCTATMVTLSQVAPSPCVSPSVTLLALSLPRVEYRPENPPLGLSLTCLQTASEEYREGGGDRVLVLLPLICYVILGKLLWLSGPPVS